jgi:hypothetical protein
MKQNFFMVYFLGVPLGGRIVLHTFKWQNLHKKKMSAPPSGRLISIRWNGSKNYRPQASLFDTNGTVSDKPRRLLRHQRHQRAQAHNSTLYHHIGYLNYLKTDPKVTHKSHLKV